VRGIDDMFLNGQHVVISGNLSNTGLAPNTIHYTGTNGTDSFDASAMSSTESIEAHGGGGNDTLTGAGGTDRLYGDDGNDILRGMKGGDFLEGGAGVDTASYASSAAGVSVSLALGTGSGGEAQGDSLTNIENLIGTAYNDVLTGSDGDNVLVGGAGADKLVGGLGVDTADYSSAPADLSNAGGVVVNLTSGVNHFSDARGDTLSGIENLRGSAYADILVGNANANKLWGSAGTDILSGNAGADELWGEVGNDALDGGAGDDVLQGGDGNDIVTGGVGFDELWAASGKDTFVFNSSAEISSYSSTGALLGQDKIMDFEAGTALAAGNVDLIDLQRIDANSKTSADDSFKLIGSGAFTKAAGQLRYESGVSATGESLAKLQGDVNGDGKAEFEMLVKYTGMLSASDFLL
jgi:Ca2+-binding RTX toxin-like protein